ncbi:unnamed protein product [Brachionus calyciflorus]|uniref:Uncharacterized protein n=1 Tax=Brachionus calyciflorus TaxID=104777 RepID=A0A814IN70_9BILA|nr:unnamed protein product [Brachionus calyciflorus]
MEEQKLKAKQEREMAVKRKNEIETIDSKPKKSRLEKLEEQNRQLQSMIFQYEEKVQEKADELDAYKKNIELQLENKRIGYVLRPIETSKRYNKYKHSPDSPFNAPSHEKITTKIIPLKIKNIRDTSRMDPRLVFYKNMDGINNNEI